MGGKVLKLRSEILREEGRQKGREEGREEGRQEGREEGRQEGRQEGREEGRQEGREEGENRVNQLNAYLISEKRFDDLARAVNDRQYQTELYKEYGL